MKMRSYILEHQTGPSVGPPVASVDPPLTSVDLPVTLASYHDRMWRGVTSWPLWPTYGYELGRLSGVCVHLGITNSSLCLQAQFLL